MRILYFITFLCSIQLHGQNIPIPIDNVNYKMVEMVQYVNGEKVLETAVDNIIFEFRNGFIRTNMKNQQRTFILKEASTDTLINPDSQQTYPSYVFKAVDDADVNCYLYVGWNRYKEYYFIITSYNNANFFFKGHISAVGMDKGYQPLPGHKMYKGDYTKEEIEKFIEFLIKWNALDEFFIID